ncbi:hypothetical protein AURDEDRAFT_124545 [Auricularia subglabra TFB-10046 SS5]|nr:hypothetical protein AURDEDRAFT_124545 [Auricularia subglabra TFB-10046 SS5]
MQPLRFLGPYPDSLKLAPSELQYARESIGCAFVDCDLDEQPAIDLIEESGARPGILSCLDQERFMPKVTHATFAAKLRALWMNSDPPGLARVREPRPWPAPPILSAAYSQQWLEYVVFETADLLNDPSAEWSWDAIDIPVDKSLSNQLIATCWTNGKNKPLILFVGQSHSSLTIDAQIHYRLQLELDNLCRLQFHELERLQYEQRRENSVKLPDPTAQLQQPQRQEEAQHALTRKQGQKQKAMAQAEVHKLRGMMSPAVSSMAKSSVGTPADYSEPEEMLNESLKRNITIVLESGSGETHIAVLRLRLEVERQAALGTNKASWTSCPPCARPLTPLRPLWTQWQVALCQQQHRLLERELPCSVGFISGALQPDKWTSAGVWKQVVSINQVVVSTPQVLLDALRHAYMDLGLDVGLLIFDEAHHALRGHPYNRIMREFYDPLEAADKQFIMGLTASPLNVEYDLLCRALATRENEEELRAHVFPPTLKHVIYYHRPRHEQPECLQSLSSVYDDLDLEDNPFVRHLRHALQTPHDGPVDAVERERQEARLAKPVRKRNTVTHKTLKTLLKSALDTFYELGPSVADWFVAASVDKLRRPIDASQEFSFFNSKRTTEDVALPARHPRQSEASGSIYSGIIFVTLRTASLLLSKVIFAHPKTRDAFHVGYLMGWSNDERRRNVPELLVGGNDKAQEETLKDCADGRLNWLIAPSVLEEGLDVARCNCAIRFNPGNNITGWVQSRGRARARRSSFVVMFSTMQDGQEHMLKCTALEREMNAKYKEAMRKRAVGAPPREERRHYFKVEQTGALLTLNNPTAHISHFCDKLPHSAYARMVPIYDIFPPDGFMEPLAPGQALPAPKEESKLFGCTLMLLNVVSPALRKHVTPMVHPSEKAAKRQVAFDVCQKLFNAGLVNPNLLPLRPDDDPELKNMKDPMQTREALADVDPQTDAWALTDDVLGEEESWSSLIKVDRVGAAQMLSKVEPPLPYAEHTLYEHDVPRSAVVHAKRNKLALCIIRDRMVAKKWQPQYLTALPDTSMDVDPPPEGPLSNQHENVPRLSTKVLADVVESLIGVAHENGGYDAAVHMLRCQWYSQCGRQMCSYCIGSSAAQASDASQSSEKRSTK